MISFGKKREGVIRICAPNSFRLTRALQVTPFAQMLPTSQSLEPLFAMQE